MPQISLVLSRYNCNSDVPKYRFIFEVLVSVYISTGKLEGIGIEYFIWIPIT